VFLSCKQYPYASPLPGILEVHLKTKSEQIPYSPLNSFGMQLTSVRAIRSDNAKMEVFEDLRAIRRSPSYFDAFDKTAFDSALVIGQAYTPPGQFIGINIQTQPMGLIILDGYRLIPVDIAPSFESLVILRQTIDIQELKTTTVVVTMDVDSSLTRRAESFQFRPVFYVSSIQVQ